MIRPTAPLQPAAAALAAVAALSLAASGCRYDSPGEYIGPGPSDGPEDAAPDAMPDAYVHACLTDPSYTANPDTGRRYKLHPMAGTYDDGIDRCAAEGAHLAVIDSEGENDYLDAFLNNNAEPWIGIDDLDEEDIFRWVTGAGATYLNWDAGSNEPNNANGEDCAYLRNNSKWNDAGCEDMRRPLCECDPMYVPPPPRACRMATTGFTTSPSGRRLFARPAGTYAAAKADCEAMGAHLLVIGDLTENIEMDTAFSMAHWLGITDTQLEGTFRWITSSAATYRNWGVAVPVDDALDCAVLQDGGGWVNVDCAITNPYVCECDPLPP